MGFLSSLFGSAPNPKNLQILREEGFVDIDLPMDSAKIGKDGTLTIIARGRTGDEIAGFAVDIAPDWESQKVSEEDDDITFYWSKGCIRSIGSESDEFLALLAHEYQLPHSGKMALRTPISLVLLGSSPGSIQTAPAHMKAFFEQESEENYAEAFINLDIQNKIVEFHEKDNDYRTGLVTALGGAQ